MDIQIDDKKMWESLVKDKCGLDSITINDILNALAEQGYTTNDNDEIVSIEPETKEKATTGWYICRIDLYYRKVNAELPAFSIGQCVLKAEVFAAIPYMTEGLFGVYFRPATEDEIPPKPEQENTLIGADAARKEIITCAEDFQKKESSGGELTDFEKAVEHLMGQVQCGKLINLTAVTKEQSKELLSIARKQFLSEYYHSIEHYELASTLESRYKARFDGYEDADYKAWAAQDAQVALALSKKKVHAEFEKELDQAYKNQDEVVYNRGYDKGRDDARKEIISDLSDYLNDATDTLASGDYIIGLEDALEKIKGE